MSIVKAWFQHRRKEQGRVRRVPDVTAMFILQNNRRRRRRIENSQVAVDFSAQQ